MTPIDTKCSLIEAHERGFAHLLASRVIPKPDLSIWMILIPIIFVYFFYRLNRYKTGRTEFVDNYMISRKRALEAARLTATTGTPVDLYTLADQAKLPTEVLPQYRKFLGIFNDYYCDLLQAAGESFEELVRSTFRSKTDYLIMLNRFNQIEKELNTALKPHMENTTEGFNEVVGVLEQSSAVLRRESADKIFK